MTNNQHGQVPEALEDFEVRKLAAIGAVSTSSGLVERRPIEYRRELEDQFVRGFRAAEKRLSALSAAPTITPETGNSASAKGAAITSESGAVYAPMPRAAYIEFDGREETAWHTPDQMRDFADRTYALRMQQAAPKAAPAQQAGEAAESVPAVEREQERIAFKDAHRHLELYEVPDAWGRPMFKHSHVEASWLGWIARASLAAQGGK